MELELECESHPDSLTPCCEHWEAGTCNRGYETVTIPSVFEVCHRCKGKGKHDHPAFSNGITSSEWAQDWDDDSREGYLSGRYDVPCEACDGLRVVAVPDFDRLPPDLLARVEAHLDRLARDRAEQRAEQRLGY